MTELTVYNMSHEEVGKHELPDQVFANDKYEHLFHESVRLHLLSKRAGTASRRTTPTPRSCSTPTASGARTSCSA